MQKTNNIPQLRMRLLKKKDLSSLRQIAEISSETELLTRLTSNAFPEKYKKSYSIFLLDKSGKTISMVGFIELEPCAKAMYVNGFISKPYRGSHFMTRILKDIILKYTDVTFFYFDIEEDNLPAKNLIEKLGGTVYRTSSTRKSYYIKGRGLS